MAVLSGPGGRTVRQAQIIKKGYKGLYGTFDTKVEAQIWAKKHESAMEHRTFVSSVEAESTTLAEALERYRVEVSSKKKSAGREKFTIKIWSESPLGPRTLASIRGKDSAQSIKDMQARGLGQHSVRIYLALLSHLFNVARTAWGMESLTNPVELVKGMRPKLPRGAIAGWLPVNTKGLWRLVTVVVMAEWPRLSHGPSRPPCAKRKSLICDGSGSIGKLAS